MISFLFGIVVLLLQVASFALLIYCIMSFVMPQSSLFQKANAYVQPILTPLRELLYRFFPKLRNVSVDLSPLMVWLAIEIVIWLLNLLRRVF